MIINLNNYIEIRADKINDVINKSFYSKYSFEEIRENKYFLQFDNLDEIFDELKERINNNKIIIKENENNLILNIPLPTSKNNEIIFELKMIIKNNNERFNELTDLIIKLNTEMNNIKNKFIPQKNDEITNIKNEINNMKIKEDKLINENIQSKNDINYLKNEINHLKNENISLKNNMTQVKNDYVQLKNNVTKIENGNIQLKKEIDELKEKINILWSLNEHKKINISHLDSKIIKNNKEYNVRLKNWINPLKK